MSVGVGVGVGVGVSVSVGVGVAGHKLTPPLETAVRSITPAEPMDIADISPEPAPAASLPAVI